MSCRRFTHILVLPHLRVQNANAVSSPLTHGFPSMTAFLGLMWALERKAIRIGIALEFNAIGDSEGARTLIEEVIAESSGELRARAQRLLADLG